MVDKAPYEAPKRKELLKSCMEEAHASLRANSNRKAPWKYSTLRESCLGLKEEYEEKRKEYNKTCWLVPKSYNQTRIDQCDVIESLARILIEDTPNNCAVLLGALFHRLLNLKEQQPGGFFSTPADQTFLYSIIRGKLGIESPQAIDDLTYYQNLKAYRDYLNKLDNDQKKAIRYIANNPHFHDKLEDLVNQYYSNSGQIRLNFDHIDYIKSVAVLINNILLYIKDYAPQLIPASENGKSGLEQQKGDQDVTASLAQKLLKSCWTPQVRATADIDARRERWIKRVGTKCKYILIGAIYLSWLKSDRETDGPLSKTIKTILGCNGKNLMLNKENEADRETIEYALQWFQEFTKMLKGGELESSVKCEAWKGGGELCDALRRELTNIQQFTAPDTSTAAMGC